MNAPSDLVAPDRGGRELHIAVWPGYCADYHGTRAQLEAEGLIPDPIEWPHAALGQRWQSGEWAFWLKRTRPAGMKGPMKLWVSGDWWCVRVTRAHVRFDLHADDIRRKRAALRAALHQQSARGQVEWEAAWKRYRETVEDKRFQAFKRLIPGLVPPKRACRAAPPQRSPQPAQRGMQLQGGAA